MLAISGLYSEEDNKKVRGHDHVTGKYRGIEVLNIKTVILILH